MTSQAPERILRAPHVRIVDHRDATTIVGRDQVARRLEGDSAALVRVILDYLWQPRTRDELLAHLAEQSGGPIESPGVIDEAVALLRQLGAVVSARAAPHQHRSGPRPKVVLGITGAVATMHAPATVAALLHRGFEVRVVATRKALRFVRAEGLESLTHSRVVRGIWDRDESLRVPHINLAEWADLVLVYPASATTIARIAHGEFTDIVSAIAVATRAPVVIAPSMNGAMYAAPAVQRNLALLRDDGFHLVHPSLGIEVAHAPDARIPAFGPAPQLDDVLAIATMVLQSRRAGTVPYVPRDAAEWNQTYANALRAPLPWQRDTVDDDFEWALARTGITAGRFLDIGTGTGTVALDAARRGFEVVATDIASSALEIARGREGAERVLWIVDDILASNVQGRFDLAHDRGCLHLLPRARHRDYAAAVARLVRIGGALIVKVHRDAAESDRGTHRFTRDELAALFAPAFAPIEIRESTLPGPSSDAPAAFCAVFRRV